VNPPNVFIHTKLLYLIFYEKANESRGTGQKNLFFARNIQNLQDLAGKNLFAY